MTLMWIKKEHLLISDLQHYSQEVIILCCKSCKYRNIFSSAHRNVKAN